MSTQVRLFAATGVLVLCAVTVAERSQRMKRPPPVGAFPQGQTNQAHSRVADKGPVEAACDYSSIIHRNLFRPLVVAPKPGRGAVETLGRISSAPQHPKANSELPKVPSVSAGQTDPVADLALTGVVEVGGKLWVLIERISTGAGEYVALNEEFEGFRIVLIGQSSAVLQRDGREYTLTMGSKQLPQTFPQVTAATSASSPRSTVHPGQAYSGDRTAQGDAVFSESTGGFTGDLLSWAESQPLAELERMYERYGRYLSPEDRARAEAYLSARRARGR